MPWASPCQDWQISRFELGEERFEIALVHVHIHDFHGQVPLHKGLEAAIQLGEHIKRYASHPKVRDGKCWRTVQEWNFLQQHDGQHVVVHHQLITSVDAPAKIDESLTEGIGRRTHQSGARGRQVDLELELLRPTKVMLSHSCPFCWHTAPTMPRSKQGPT